MVKFLNFDALRHVRIEMLRRYQVDRIADPATVEAVLENGTLAPAHAEMLRTMADRWQKEIADGRRMLAAWELLEVVWPSDTDMPKDDT